MLGAQSAASGTTVSSVAVLYFTGFCFYLYYFLYSLTWAYLALSFSGFLNANLYYWFLHLSLFQSKLKPMNIPLSPASTASDKFYVEFSFSLKYLKIFFVISYSIHVLFKNVFLNFQIFGSFSMYWFYWCLI